MRPETVEPTLLTSDRGTTNKTVYAIGERLAVLRHVAENYGLRLDRTANMIAPGRRNANGEAIAMLQAIRRERPSHLDTVASRRPRAKSPRADPHSSKVPQWTIVQIQLSLGGNVIVEGRAADFPSRDQVFEAPGRLGTMSGDHCKVFWFAIGAQTPKNTPLCGEHSHPPWTNRECICGRRSTNYSTFPQTVGQATSSSSCMR